MTLEEVFDKFGITEKDLMDTYIIRHRNPQPPDGRMETIIRKGDVYGELEIIGIVSIYQRRKNRAPSLEKCAVCRCSCGNYTCPYLSALLNKSIKGCGCLRGEKHGMWNTRLYNEWLGMKNRCGEKSKCHKDYYDRGIRVCREWDTSFLAFKEWALANGYNDTHTLDRIK